ncbi:MAG: hypothetical protein AAB110_01245, partial [Candidatus Desantisbacteria bacterium]
MMCSIIRLVILCLVLWAGYGEAGNLPVSKNDRQSQYNCHQETKQEQLDRKSDELKQIESGIPLMKAECSKLSSQYELTQIDIQQKKDVYQKTKDEYNKSASNADMFSEEDLAKFLGNYKNAQKELKISEDKLRKIKNEKEQIESKLNALIKEKKEREIEILEIKAESYEDELNKAVWVEGSGECIMDETKTMKDCEKLALEYARRDAVERGGKSLLESVTEIKMFEITKDDIKKTSKVSIMDQDNTGDFGKVKKIIIEDVIKFTVTVRLKIQSVTTYNPYREKLKDLRKGKEAESPLPEQDVESSTLTNKLQESKKAEVSPLPAERIECPLEDKVWKSDNAASVTTCAWQMFRHDSRHTGRSPYNGPNRPALKWRY